MQMTAFYAEQIPKVTRPEERDAAIRNAREWIELAHECACWQSYLR